MKKLKIYSHSHETSTSFSMPINCCEITFQTSPDILREIASFLIRCADKIESGQANEIDHFHLQDDWKNWQDDFADVIVAQPNL